MKIQMCHIFNHKNQQTCSKKNKQRDPYETQQEIFNHLSIEDSDPSANAKRKYMEPRATDSMVGPPFKFVANHVQILIFHLG